MVEKNLIVSEVVSLVKYKKLILFSIFKTQSNLTFINHENFMEHLTFAHHVLIANIYSAF